MSDSRRVRTATLGTLSGLGFVVALVSAALAVQSPRHVPPIHQRQCVTTGEIPAGNARKVTVTWRESFATADYDVIGSVSDPTDRADAIELSHIITPQTPDSTSAVVWNRDATATHAGLLCLDAHTE